MKSFTLRQLLRCRLLRHLRSADSRLETRGVPGAAEVTDVQGKESKDGRVQRADGGSCSRGSAASGDYQPLLSGAAGGCAIRKLQLNV